MMNMATATTHARQTMAARFQKWFRAAMCLVLVTSLSLPTNAIAYAEGSLTGSGEPAAQNAGDAAGASASSSTTLATTTGASTTLTTPTATEITPTTATTPSAATTTPTTTPTTTSTPDAGATSTTPTTSETPETPEAPTHVATQLEDAMFDHALKAVEWKNAEGVATEVNPSNNTFDLSQVPVADIVSLGLTFTLACSLHDNGKIYAGDYLYITLPSQLQISA